MDKEETALPMPDKQFIKRIICRYTVLIIFVACITGLLTLQSWETSKNSYESSTVSVLNPLEEEDQIAATLPLTSDKVIMRLFTIWFESPKFLQKIADRVGRSQIELEIKGKTPSPQFTQLMRIKAFIKPKPPKSDSTGDIDQDIINWLKHRIEVEPEKTTGILNLTAKGPSAKLAQSIAANATELFIQSILENDAARLKAETEFLQSLIPFNGTPDERNQTLNPPFISR